MGTGNVLITGAGGMLGRRFADLLGERAVTLARPDLDIADAAAFERLARQHRVTAVINAAGGARGTHEELFALNGLYPAELARVCRELGIPLVFLSSSRVFGGRGSSPWTEADVPDPADAYGLSKLVGERLVELTGLSHYVVRLPLVLGSGGQPLTGLLDRARRDGRLHVAEDVVHTPVHAADAARVVADLLDRGLPPGRYHVASRDSASLHSIVRTAAEATGIGAEILQARAERFDREPLLNLALASTKLPAVGGWREAVLAFAREYGGRP